MAQVYSGNYAPLVGHDGNGDTVLAKPGLREEALVQFRVAGCAIVGCCFPPLWLCLPCGCIQFNLEAKAQHITLTDKAIIVQSRSHCACCRCEDKEKTIPLEKITDITVKQDWLRRVYGIHVLEFQTAGQGTPVAELVLDGLDDPMAFKAAVMQAKAAHAAGASATITTAPAPQSYPYHPSAPFHPQAAHDPPPGFYSPTQQSAGLTDDRKAINELRESVHRIEDTLRQIERNTAAAAAASAASSTVSHA